MNIQIFGTKKCNDTKKAERFFKERRIKGTLPVSKTYIKNKVETVEVVKKVLTTEEKVIQLFGEGNVIIKEE